MTILTRVLSLADSVVGSFGMLDRPLDPDELILLARKQTGLQDFGDAAFIGPLVRLLEACSTEASLSIVGRSATRWDVVRFLSNLLTIEAACVSSSGDRHGSDSPADLHHRFAAQRHDISASIDADR